MDWAMILYSGLVAAAVSTAMEVWFSRRRRKSKEVPDGAVHAEPESGASDVD
jgi:hypothetical protein